MVFLETSAQTPLGNVFFTPEECVTEPEVVGSAGRTPLICRWVTGDDGDLIGRWVPAELLIDPCRQAVIITNRSAAAVA